MKIDSIFDDRLFSIKYENEEKNELRRLIDLWSNPESILAYFEENVKYFEGEFFAYGYSPEDFLDDVFDDLERLIYCLNEIEENQKPLENYFELLSKSENKRILSFNKKRYKHIRVYAIKIDTDTYLVTGGALKITADMHSHADTKKCKSDLELIRQKLLHQRLENIDSLSAFIMNDYQL